MSKATDVKISDVAVWFLPVTTRVPFKFGHEIMTQVTCARVCLEVTSDDGRTARGWGETPLSVQWVWPSKLPYDERYNALEKFTIQLAEVLREFSDQGHPMEVGYAFISGELKNQLTIFNENWDGAEDMPWLAALVCMSAFDIALHDAYAVLHEVPVYDIYNRTFMNSDLAAFIEPADDVDVSFAGKYPADFFAQPTAQTLPAWHLVGGTDAISTDALNGSEPDDGYPVLFADWIERDGLKCVKVKLCGNDLAWDYARLLAVGEICIAKNVNWITADFNCTVMEPAYVNEILDRLVQESPRIYGMILYIEQPFPYELEKHKIDVHSVSARKPLFMDESAHDWQHVRLGRSLGWTGVALKTCKTQTGALLSMCWAKAHGMTLMVQDLSNPMLAQIPHVQLAAHAGTIMGVETNSMQFYPEASAPEEKVHPGLYRRQNGELDLSSLTGTGFGYRHAEIERELGEPTVGFACKA